VTRARRAWLTRVGAGLALALLLPVAGPAGPATATATGLDWWDCGGGFECATAAVPLDYDRPAGESIDLAVIRHPARDPAARIGSLFVNPGGPGNSGLTFLRAAVDVLFPRLANRFDLVSWDQRGAGRSAPVRCLSDERRDAQRATGTPFPTARDLPRMVAEARETVAGCQAVSAAVLPHLSTENTARDLDRLRAAVGDEKLTYLGLSYGTYLGATYASMFPRRVRALALDAAVNPAQYRDQPLLRDVEQSAGFERALHRFLDWCAATPAECAFSGADPAAAFRGLLADLVDAPIPAAGRGDPRPVTAETAVVGTLAALYARQSWPFLGLALAQAAAGDGSLLQLAADAYWGRDDDGHYSGFFDSFLAITSVDKSYPRSVGAFVAAARAARVAAPTFGTFNVYAGLPAAMWQVTADDRYLGRFTYRASPGAPPALVVGTTHDPATPYPGAVAMARQLGHAILLTMDGDGHAAYGRGGPCVDDAVDSYLTTLAVPAAGTVCPQQLALARSPSLRPSPSILGLSG
jgi:pimeloyl-ACP methyl ester carboxylesterase